MTTRTHLRRATRCSSAQPRRHVATRGQRDATFAQVLQPPTGNENDPADRRQGALRREYYAARDISRAVLYHAARDTGLSQSSAAQ
jgi:hypothetical protein